MKSHLPWHDADLRGERSFEAAWRERFESFATDRDDDAGIAGWTRTGLDARLRRFVGLWQPTHVGAHWLDAGCGAGTYTRALHAAGARVVGVDYSLPTLAKASLRTDAAVAFAVADVRQLPFAPRAFDGVLCLGVMQALGASKPALAELARVVNAGGELWVDALNHACLANLARLAWRRLLGRPAHLRYEWPAAIRETFIEHGFADLTLHWMPIVPGRWPRLQRLLERSWAQRCLAALPWAGALASHSFIVRGVKRASGGPVHDPKR